MLSSATRETMSSAELDIVPLVGKPPYRRLRIGTYRVLFRPATTAEVPLGGYLVVRIVHRRDLERAKDSLP